MRKSHAVDSSGPVCWIQASVSNGLSPLEDKEETMIRASQWQTAWVAGAALAALIGATTASANGGGCDGREAIRLVNGRIHTMDAKDRVVSSVLIKNGKFAAVGRGFGDDGDHCTKTINLRGRTAVPGIIDNHNHILLLGLRPGHDTRLENANSIQEALDTLAARSADLPAGEWITSIGGFSRNQFFPDPQPIRFPTIDELSKAVPAHPVFIMESFAGPGATNALGKSFFESHGVTVGADGGIGAGAPSLTALFLLRQMQTLDTQKRGLRDAMAYAASVGVTTHLDQGGFPAVGNNTDGAANFDRYRAFDSVRALYHEGKLTNRIWINFLHLEEDPATPELQARLNNAFNDFGDHMMRVLGIGEFTAGPFTTPGNAAWQNGTRLVARAGWRNENHSLNFSVNGVPDWKVIIDGWQAVHDELVAAGNPDGIKKLRWVLAHVPVIDNDYLQKLKNLGGGVSVLGGWRWLTGTATANGPPFRTILNSGIRTGMSSDGMQISTMSPWINLYYVVTGKNARGLLINAGQQLTRKEGLRLYTAENGWFLSAEDKLGTIEEGKLGDVIVLNKNYFDAGEVPDEAIKDVHSVLTIVNGKIVHDDLDRKKKKYWDREWRREHLKF
jgi:predicted amidohydrolase YtcJ